MDHPHTNCAACPRLLTAWEAQQGRLACTPCQTAAEDWLKAIPGMYTSLDDGLGYTAIHVDGVRAPAGSRVPPGVDLDRAALTGGSTAVLPQLASWARALADARAEKEIRDELPARWDRDDNGKPRSKAGALCGWLRFRLDWACHDFTAIDDLIEELRRIHRRLEIATDGRPAERLRACPCGGVIHWRCDRDSYHCPGCGARYGREEAAALPAAPRRRAVAA
ncbi:hypothetical protein RM780_04115 [Streptomyces sp. DSM 44917]|uniref:Uncharacterized protein n=1 Tax=Streptomyces boetiae TaxID=3075541 RepID=A0ABU2L3Q4_9ACTN|nr:hypothetical protein [Streptomyces sp. DSM 44917]MDT0306147.1 hypothetical protein [Streptomyces sp. DSM 44917]